MNRGDIFWVNLDPTQGAEIQKRRPCVLIGATPINQIRRTVVIIPLSTAAKPRPPLTIEVNALNQKSVAVCDQIRAVDKTRLLNQAGKLTSKDLKALENGLRQILCL